MGLAQRAHVVSESKRPLPLRPRGDAAARAGAERETLLLFRTPDDGRMAIPLALVARLEEFPAEAVEHSGDQDVVQYRGDILPLVHVDDVLSERRMVPRTAADASGSQPSMEVVVYTGEQGSVGLVVDQILDIVEESLFELRPGSREGVRGCLVIQDRVTEMLDIDSVIAASGVRTRARGRRDSHEPNPVLHLLSRRAVLRDRGRQGPGGHPLPGDDAGAPGATRHPGPDQPAGTDRHRHRPAPPAGVARPARGSAADERRRSYRRRRGQPAGRRHRRRAPRR